MKAKEMFEDLGYVEVNSMKNVLTYAYLKDDNIEKPMIHFHLISQILASGCDLTKDEHQAIAQQLKELGWENDKTQNH